jgi:hypothetical protein
MHFLAQSISSPATLMSFIDGSSKIITETCSASDDVKLQSFGKGVANFTEWLTVGAMIGGAGMALYFALTKGRYEQQEHEPKA